jgi:hypothetical protein
MFTQNANTLSPVSPNIMFYLEFSYGELTAIGVGITLLIDRVTPKPECSPDTKFEQSISKG